MTEIHELLQLIRTIKVSQLRKQLEHDFNSDPEDVTASYYKDRYYMVRDFFKDVKEQS